jgi:uncharacterized protein YndB with AHSA1/START domain
LDDWHTPKAVLDLQVGGKFVYTVAAKDGSFSFDFEGTYLTIDPQKHISIELGDGRSMKVAFFQKADGVLVKEIF